MKRIRLRFESIQQVSGSRELAVILLTDEERVHALSVVCDEPMTRQLLMRVQHPEVCRNMLPEALVQFLGDPCEMMVYGIHDGQYQVVLADRNFDRNVRIRMSDAVLLSLISNYPLYIEQMLFLRQCVPFDEHATGIAIPINTMDVHRLDEALKHAVDEENYELASVLRDELKRRKDSKE